MSIHEAARSADPQEAEAIHRATDGLGRYSVRRAGSLDCGPALSIRIAVAVWTLVAALTVSIRAAAGSSHPGPAATASDSSRFLVSDQVRRSAGSFLITAITTWNSDRSVDRTREQAMQASQRAAVEAARVCVGAAPSEVRFALRSGGVTGGSAGLMLALAVVRHLEERDLTAGRRIAGTGTIDARGRVGDVEGVAAKAEAAAKAGAVWFFVPVNQVIDAAVSAPNLRVIGVETLDDAMYALRGRGCGST